ncbi:MAG: uracil-DNA glycosylase family protein [Candidatus Solibacter sp.]
MKLLATIGINIAAPMAGDAGGGAVFMTNAILCLKEGGMQAKVQPQWFADCGIGFLKPTIDLISPSVVVTLGERACKAMAAVYELPRMAFRAAVEMPEGLMLASGTRCFPMYHCGARILNTHRPMDAQLRDWQRVRRALGRAEPLNKSNSPTAMAIWTRLARTV